MSLGHESKVTIKFQDGTDVECDISKPSKEAKTALKEWMIGLKSKRPMQAGEILLALSIKPRTPDELSNPTLIVKMQLVKWIEFDQKNQLWSITKLGKDVLAGKV